MPPDRSISAEALARQLYPVQDYDLSATLSCGQAFRWEQAGVAWEGVVRGRWFRLRQLPEGILAETPCSDPGNAFPSFLAGYLQVHVDLAAILATFPDDRPMRAAAAACRGLRLLRQDPWECLASFLLSSTKQIVQIRQIIGLLCRRFGEPVRVPPGHPPAFAFPSAARLAGCGEPELRDCKMGFRAPNLLQTARLVAGGVIQLETLAQLPLDEARRQLIALPGVGRKIADCVLLFAGGFATAFPVDVWVRKALSQLYFPHRRPAPARLRSFADTHFGPNAGYAQQYLFHHVRQTGKGRSSLAGLLPEAKEMARPGKYSNACHD